MTTSQFMQIKLSAKAADFKQLIGLQEVDTNAAFIMDFCSLLHPNQAKTAQGAKVNVFTDKAQYVYTLYKGAIVRTAIKNGIEAKTNKTIYKY